MSRIAAEMVEAWRQMGTQRMDDEARITVDPAVCGGRPCIRGMRIRVIDVLEMLASGMSQDEILADYPYLQREDIAACLRYAAHWLDHAMLRAS